MVLHGFDQLSFGNPAIQIQLGVQRVELEKITVGAAWRTGTAVSQTAKIIFAVPGAGF